MVQKKVKKGKSLKGKSGREAVKHATGTAAQHISRTRAIRKLQITLKDFRRLCILKGVYPRDPKKKRDGRDKTYYHVKDIAYLQHEPLLRHFRELKVFLRKYKRAQMKGDEWRVRQLDEQRPVFTLHHLLRERYPQFYLALNDMDDALNLLHLFDLLPTQTKVRHFTLDYAATIHALLNEWCAYVIHTHSLTKAFITIKGIYFQAEVDGVRITWLAPFQFTQHTPDDVDYRVMFTFVQFYVVLARFVHFKLYHDAQLVYPPRVDARQLEEGYDLSSTHVEVRQAGGGSEAGGGPEDGKVDKGDVERRDEKLQKRVNAVVKGLNGQAAATDDMDEAHHEDDAGDASVGDGRKEAEEKEQAADTAAFNAIEPPSAASVDYDKRRTLFSACTFYLSREVPFRPLELVIRSAGGTIATSTGSEVPAGVTHYVTDRARVAAAVVAGDVHVIQPQWVFDSFNLRVLVPVSLYRLGVLCPPHLSPFVEEAEGEYQPKQLAAQRGWQAGRAGEVRDGEEGEVGEGEGQGGEGEDDGMDEEERYEVELQKEMEERKQGSEDDDQEDEEEEDDDDDHEADEQEESDDEQEEAGADDEENDAQEAEDEEEEEQKQPPAAIPIKRKTTAEAEEDESRELAKIMMNKKHARLYQRIQYGRARKEAANEVLRQKREEAEGRERETAVAVKGKGRVKRAVVVEQSLPMSAAKRKRV